MDAWVHYSLLQCCHFCVDRHTLQYMKATWVRYPLIHCFTRMFWQIQYEYMLVATWVHYIVFISVLTDLMWGLGGSHISPVFPIKLVSFVCWQTQYEHLMVVIWARHHLLQCFPFCVSRSSMSAWWWSSEPCIPYYIAFISVFSDQVWVLGGGCRYTAQLW